MNVIIYDTNFGNTRKVAEALAASLGDDTRCVSVADVTATDLQCDLLIVGCPINAWRPTPKINELLGNLSPGQLSGVRAAAFDTRVDSILSGNAARKIAHMLSNAGASIITAPKGFIVTGKEGPLAGGELDKVAEWAKAIKKLMVEKV